MEKKWVQPNDNEACADTEERLGATDISKRAMNLQLFADKPVDMSLIADMTDADKPKYLFTVLGETKDDADDGDDVDDDDVDEGAFEPDDPVLFPRLAVTDQNLPQTAVGEMVTRSVDGELHTVAVDKDGNVTDSSFKIGADNIEEGCLTGSKLEEGTITSRELDMEDLFADETLFSQALTANLDAEELFANEDFQARLDERVAAQAVLKNGNTMTGPLLLSDNPTSELGAATKQYVDQMLPLANVANNLTTTAASRALDARQGRVIQDALNARVNLGNTKPTIPEKANLNTYMTPGSYTCTANVIAATLTNSPTRDAFQLDVSYPLNTDYYVTQELTTYICQKYMRRAAAGVFTAWQKIF